MPPQQGRIHCDGRDHPESLEKIIAILLLISLDITGITKESVPVNNWWL